MILDVSGSKLRVTGRLETQRMFDRLEICFRYSFNTDHHMFKPVYTAAVIADQMISDAHYVAYVEEEMIHRAVDHYAKQHPHLIFNLESVDYNDNNE